MSSKAAQHNQKSRRQRRLTRPVDNLAKRMTFFDEVLRFRHFLASAFDPVVRDAEIVVCFADVRGFTDYCRRLQREMQDRKIQNFLRSYVRVFAEGLLTWFVDNEKDKDPTLTDIRKHIVPTMYKNLGDGMMLAWEIPEGMDTTLQGRLTQEILFLIDMFSDQFNYRFRNLFPSELDSYSAEVEKLEIGFGIAKGHAWRLDFGHTIDYAGSVINLAARLESLARPSSPFINA